jgi:hypothetical protein
LRDITTDDLRNQARINLLRTAVIGHIFYPNAVDWVYVVERGFVCNFASINILLFADL